MLVFGRTTYQGMAAYWQPAPGEVAEVADLMNSLPKVVFSRTLANADWKNTRLVKGDAVAEMRRLKSEGEGNIFVFGSAILSDTFIKNGLFDEYRLAVAPIVLGGGTPLFKSNPDQLKLKFIDSRSLESGCVILRYGPPGD